MATYIQGVTGYIPQIQAFKPDFNFYNKALQMKQSKYDQAHEQMSNLYGSLLNAPMLREQNIETRDQFFKAIDQDIQKMSGMDLSLQQNVDAGVEVFNQLLDNDNIVKDMVWTRNWQNEHKRAEGYRDCIDPEKCGGAWWEGGVKALNFQAEEFKNASDAQAQNMGNVRYTPYQDMMAEAIKLAKEADLNITIDQIQGGYITTTKNGPQLTGPLANLFMGKFANDPKFKDYYKTKAYVDRKEWVQGNLETYGSIDAAEQAYVDEITNMMSGVTQTAEDQINSEVGHTTGQRKQLEDRIRTQGATPDSPLARQYREMNNLEGNLVQSQGVIRDANGNMKNVTNRKGGSPRAAFDHIDNAMAMMSMGQDINSAATTLAYKDYEFSLKEDPYSFEGYKQANRLALESVKHANSLELEQYKYALKDEYEQRQAMGNELENVPSIITDLLGGTDIADELFADDPNKFGGQAGYELFEKERNSLLNDVTGGEKALLQEALLLTQMKSLNEKGNGVATQDLIKMGDFLYSELAKTQTGHERIPGVQGVIDQYTDGTGSTSMYQKWANASDDEKIKIVQSADFKALLSGNSLPNAVLSTTYNDMLLPMMDMSNEANRINKDYLGNLWETTGGIRDRINAKNSSLDQLDKWYAKESLDIINSVRKDNPEHATLLEHYVDSETGRIRTADQFADSYAKAQSQNVDANGQPVLYAQSYEQAYNEALEMYREDKQYSPGLGDWIYSGFDAIGTTIAGSAGATVDALEWIMPWNDVEEGQWLSTGFDYDSPWDVANWEASGNNGKANQGLHDIWKRAFTKYATPEGGYQALGITGTGSKTASALNFSIVDPSKYKSSGTMNTMGFMKDVAGAGPEMAKIIFGGPKLNVPEETSNEAKRIFSQVMMDMYTKNTAKDNKRPMLNVTYQPIAGSDENWTAMNIKLNEQYVNAYLGSKDNPGPMREYKEQLMNDGLTVYLNKNKATNGFYQATQNTDLDRVMGYTGQYEFDSYPGVTQNLKLTKNKSTGGYEVIGNIMAGIDEQGQPIWQPHYNPYQSPLSDPNMIVQDYNQLLKEISLGNQTLMTQYNMMNGVKDPEQLR